MDDVHLPASLDLKIDRVLNDGRLELHYHGLNRKPIPGRRLDNRHISKPAQCHIERSRNGRGGHGQDVDFFSDLLQALFVRDTEPLLFIDDHQAEIVKLNVLREQPVRSDHNIHLSGFHIGDDLLLLLRIHKPAEHRDRDRKCREPLFECFEMLVAKDCCRC